MNHAIPKHLKSLFILLGLASIFPASLTGTTVSSLDDITYWVGEGSNKAALAIDWFGDEVTDTALVWGYRWNGAATGEQMLRDVLADDSRFYAKLSSGGSLGIATYGFGYDDNNDDEFELDDNTNFNADGIAFTSPSDGAEAGEGDRYREGWSSGYWHYALANSGANDATNNWTSSGSGPTTRLLFDGDWDSYAFAVTLNNDEFATNLIAAEADVINFAGDFNNDGSVDAADYTVWRDGFGTTYTQSDYDDWITNYGSSSNSFASSVTIPEPATAALTTIFLVSLFFPRHGQRRSEEAIHYQRQL